MNDAPFRFMKYMYLMLVIGPLAALVAAPLS